MNRADTTLLRVSAVFLGGPGIVAAKQNKMEFFL